MRQGSPEGLAKQAVLNNEREHACGRLQREPCRQERGMRKVTSEPKEARGVEERGQEGSVRKGLLDEGGDRLHWAVKGRLSRA